MGSETNKALRARRQQSSERITRLIARAEVRSATRAATRQRVNQSLALARRRLRGLHAAQRAAAALEVEIGHALLRVVAEGLSRNEAFARAGLSRHVGRKYVAAARAAQEQLPTNSSTGAPGPQGASPGPAHLGDDGSHLGADDERTL
jgi:hypothetical protein